MKKRWWELWAEIKTVKLWIVKPNQTHLKEPKNPLELQGNLKLGDYSQQVCYEEYPSLSLHFMIWPTVHKKKKEKD